jgi:hypothetical protein
MQAFKLQHFASAHPEDVFPSFTSITSEEIERLRDAFCQRAHVNAMTDWGELYRHLQDRAEHLEGVNAEDEDRFDLAAELRALDIVPSELVYVAWDPRRGEVDQIAFIDLARHFQSIWYPSSDDIEIFDDSLAWLLFVDHEGQLSVVWLGGA